MRLPPKKLVMGLPLAIGYAGLLEVFGHEIWLQGADAVLGAVLVFLSAISYVVYLSISDETVRRLGSLRLAGLTSTAVCVLCIGQFFVLRPLTEIRVAPEMIWLSVINAMLCKVASVLLVMMGIERIGAGLAVQTGAIATMSTVATSALLLGEPLTVWVEVGTALTLAGIGVFSS